MSFLDLPLDTDALLAGLRPWIECESPTFDVAAVNRMMDLVAGELSAAGAAVTRFPGPPGLGDCVRGDFPHPRRGEPGILVMSHLDTVHPVGTLAALPFRREGERCYGPGIVDMKGGAFVACRRSSRWPRPASRRRCRSASSIPATRRSAAPARATSSWRRRGGTATSSCRSRAGPDNGVVTGRYAIARFNLLAEGRPSHAGAHPVRRPLRDQPDGAAAARNRGDDRCRLHLQRRRHRGRALGELRADDLPGRGAEHGQAPGGSRPWRGADAGAVGRAAGRHALHGRAGRDAPGLGAGRGDDGALRAGARRSRARSASTSATPRPAAARTPISPARPVLPRSMGSVCSAPPITRSTSISWSKASCRAAA